MRRLLRDKRALSPVLAAVMMILVASIGMSVLFAFFVNYSRDFQVGSGSSVLESMTIEDVSFTSGTAVVWVYNVGKVDFKIAAVYVDGHKVEPELVSVRLKGQDVTSSSSGSIPVGGHGELSVPWQFASGGNYTFKVVTERGSSFEGRYKWGQ
jgi:FlaG/FlaF family flagellin (archaellin)